MPTEENFHFKSSIHALDPKDLLELLQAAYTLMQSHNPEKMSARDFDERSMIHLLVYCVDHMKEIDSELLEFIAKLLGIDLQNLQKERDELEEEQEHEEEISQELKEKQMKFIIYEYYKITNPAQLAGERPIENFVNNLMTRGIKTALKHNPEFKSFFSKDEIQDIASHRPSFIKGLEAEGVQIGGKGGLGM